MNDCCCLSVILSLDEGDYPEYLQIVYLCHYKYKRSFEPFMCLDQTKNS